MSAMENSSSSRNGGFPRSPMRTLRGVMAGREEGVLVCCVC